MFTASLLLSFTGLNRTLLAPIQGYAAFDPSFDIYFQDAALFNYSAGFRLDFTAFSLAPVVVILILMYRRDRVTLDTTGWWISLYLLLASIYQLFSFAPFSDRFGAFAWSIIPIVVFIALLETHSRRIVTTATIAFAIMNVLMLQFYTGAVLLGA